MKIAILIALLGLAASTTVTISTCSCTQAVNSADCLQVQNGQCFWTGTACRTKVCADYVGTDYSSCSSVSGCALSTSNTCVTFTSCSSYSVAVASTCYSIRGATQRCEPGTTGATSTVCQNATVTATAAAPTCSTGIATTCSSLSTSGGSCAWNGTACVAYASTSCSYNTPFGQNYCSTSRCAWVNSACVSITCANAASCTTIPANWDRTQYTICGGSPCAEVSITTLTSTTCTSMTGSGAIWSSGNVCTACHAFALFATFILTLLF